MSIYVFMLFVCIYIYKFIVCIRLNAARFFSVWFLGLLYFYILVYFMFVLVHFIVLCFIWVYGGRVGFWFRFVLY